MSLYHIISQSDWSRFKDEKYYSPESLRSEGYIHLSTRSQLVETANLFFKGQKGLLVLVLESIEDSHLKWEDVPSRNEKFPHYYGELPVSQISAVYEFEPNEDGSFSFPSGGIEPLKS